jgi:hypothetical protein
MKRGACAILLPAIFACGGGESVTEAPVLRAMPPRPVVLGEAAAADRREHVIPAPFAGVVAETVGNRAGVPYRLVTVFLPPNRIHETLTIEVPGATLEPVVRWWDGVAMYERSKAAPQRLAPHPARALFERALDLALLFRLYEDEPSLAVRALSAAEGREFRFGDRAAQVFEVAHGRAGYARLLYFGDEGTLLGMRGSATRDDHGAPQLVATEFLATLEIDGRSLPTRFVTRSGDRVIDEGETTYRFDALPDAAELFGNAGD